MKLEQSFEIQAPLDQVWEALIDLERVAPCLPGAAITHRDDEGAYHGTFVVKLGPVTASYNGVVTVEVTDAAGHVTTLRAKGTDKRGQGGATATMVSRMSEAGSSTRIEASTDMAITGRLARFGRPGMIQDISNRMLREFADCLQQRLAAEQAVPAGAGAGTSGTGGAGDGAMAGAAAAGTGIGVPAVAGVASEPGPGTPTAAGPAAGAPSGPGLGAPSAAGPGAGVPSGPGTVTPPAAGGPSGPGAGAPPSAGGSAFGSGAGAPPAAGGPSGPGAPPPAAGHDAVPQENVVAGDAAPDLSSDLAAEGREAAGVTPMASSPTGAPTGMAGGALSTPPATDAGAGVSGARSEPPQPPPSAPPKIEAAPPVEGLSLMAGVLGDQVKRNSTPIGAALGVLLFLLFVRTRRR